MGVFPVGSVEFGDHKRAVGLPKSIAVLHYKYDFKFSDTKAFIILYRYSVTIVFIL